VTISDRIAVAAAQYRALYGRAPTLALLGMDIYDDLIEELGARPAGRPRNDSHIIIAGVRVMLCAEVTTLALAHHHVSS